jgi:SAM-dependent methyltransferase
MMVNAATFASGSATAGHDKTLAPHAGGGSRGERLERTSCLLCGEDDSEVLAESDATERKIVRCRRDGLIYLNPRPDTESLEAFFESGFIPLLDQEMLKSFRRATLKREADLIKRLKPRGGNLLDIGCAMGTFFENFSPPPKWSLFGVDSASFNLEKAAALLNAKVFVGTLRGAHYPDSFFDVVTLFDTLYLLSKPAVELAEVRRILKPDGILVIEIQGLNYTLLRKRGPIALALDGKWWSLTPNASTQHLYYFSPAAVKEILEKAGFSIVRMVPGQASVSGRGLMKLANHLQFAVARMVFAATRGKLSIAARELYLSVRDPHGEVSR